MASLRRRLRLCATTWLVFQVAWLAALVPRDCCAAHRPAEKSCHESAPSSTDCRLGGVCDGPMAALFTLLSNHGILPDSATPLPELALRSARMTINQHVIDRFEPPDAPPPRTSL